MSAPLPVFPSCHPDNLVWFDSKLIQLNDTYGPDPIANSVMNKTKELALTYLHWLDLSVPLGDAAKIHMDNVMIALETARDEASTALNFATAKEAVSS